MKFFRKVTDERQNLEAMRVANVAVWIAIIGLAIVSIVQLMAFGFDITHIAGESIVFCVVITYMIIRYYRLGIWDFYSKPGIKSYFIYSLGVMLIYTGISFSWRYFGNGASVLDSLLAVAINGMIYSTAVFVVLALIGTLTKKRQKKLTERYADDDNNANTI